MRAPWPHHVITPADLAAVGIAVSTDEPNLQVCIRRCHDGTWRVLEMWTEHEVAPEDVQAAMSLAISVVNGVNLIGAWTCDLVVSGDVRWVGLRPQRRSHCARRKVRTQGK